MRHDNHTAAAPALNPEATELTQKLRVIKGGKKKRTRAAVKPVTVKQPRSQVHDYLTILEIAFIVGRTLKHPLTVYQISGAVRALGLKLDHSVHKTHVTGLVVYRQHTMVHRSKLDDIAVYLKEKLGV